MSAYKRRFSNWLTVVAATGLVVGGIAIITTGVFSRFTPAGSQVIPGVRQLTDSEMRNVVGGWLEPKARRLSTGGCSGGCPGDDGGDVCENCSVGVCPPYQPTDGSPEGGAPQVDAATSDVCDGVHVLSAGPAGGGLSVGLGYASHLADGTNTIVDAGLGDGWTHTHNSYLQLRGGSFFWYRCNSEIVRFTYRAGEYHASSGQPYTLTRIGQNAEVKLKNGTVYLFHEATTPWQEPDAVIFVLDAVVDANERSTEFEYEPDGRLKSVTDPDNNSIDYEYTPQGRLQRVSAGGREADFEYGPTGQISAVDLPGDKRVEWEYNHRGQIVQKTVSDGRDYGGEKYRLEYTPLGKVERLESYNPRTDKWELVASLLGGAEPDYEKSQLTGEMHYHPGTATMKDGRGNDWEYDYDERGRISAVRRPDGGGSSFEYDPVTLRPSRATDANGRISEYEYDARGNRTLVRDAEGNETEYEYEPVHNRLVRRIEPDGDEWGYEYDANGNLLREIDPLHGPGGASVVYEYDPQGRLIHQTDRNGNETHWEYDAQGNVSKAIDPIGVETTYEYDYFGNVLSRTLHADDPNTPGNEDRTATYTYDARDRVVTQTDPLGVSTHYEYDAGGNRTAVYSDWIDETHYRSVTRYEYDERGRLTRTVEDEGGLDRTMEYEYDENGNLAREINPAAVATDYEYDSLNRLVRTTLDPSVPPDPNDPNSVAYDGLDIAWQYEYDPVGNRLSETNPNGHTTTYEYDSLDRLRFTTDPLGYISEYRYFPPGGGCCGTPGSSLIKCVIDAEGKVTRYGYDKLDRRTHVIRQVGMQDCDRDPQPQDAVTEYEYDANGNVVAVTDANGNMTFSTYTSRDEVETVANGCGETATYAYDAAGNQVSAQRPSGAVMHSEYDLNSRLVRVYDALGDMATYTYDPVGNRLTEADAVGPPTTYEYDTLNRLSTVTDPMGEATYYEYDAVGNLTRVVDREGNQTVYVYDAANRQTAMNYWPDAGGSPSVITRQYDPAGALARITDANGNATEYEYDANGRQITETFADQTEKRFTYDGVGNLLTREDNMGEDDNPGNITTYVYDDLHRLMRQTHATGEIADFEYDQGGRMLLADNLHAHVGYTYDCADRILTSTQTDLPQTYSYVVTYAYDVYANTRTITYPSGKVVVETRDLRDRLHTVNADGADVATYAYDLAGRVLTKTFGNGTEARYGYNDNDWVAELRHVLPDGVTTFAGFAHDYDKEGNRLNARNLQQTIPYDDAKPVTHSEAYQYDDMYRLIDYRRGQWVGGDVPSPRRQRDWQLDPVHNWEQFGIHDLDTGEDETYCNSINQMNEYDDPSTDGPCPIPDDDGVADDFMLSPCPAAPLPGGSGALLDRGATTGAWNPAAPKTLTRGAGLSNAQPTPAGDDDPQLPATGFNRTHDKNGNLVDDGQKEYYYDYQSAMTSCLRSANRLTMVKDKITGDVLGEYGYDALGRRIRKLVPGTPDVSMVYVYTADWRAVEEYEEGTLACGYAYGDWIDEILTMDRAAETDRFFYHVNALGSIVAASDEAGAAVERYASAPYGDPALASGNGTPIGQSATGNAYLFAGRRYDPESGLYYYRTRYLDPIGGRFTTLDMIGIWGDESNLGNGHSYASNNPMTVLDVFGMKSAAGDPCPNDKCDTSKTRCEKEPSRWYRYDVPSSRDEREIWYGGKARAKRKIEEWALKIAKKITVQHDRSVCRRVGRIKDCQKDMYSGFTVTQPCLAVRVQCHYRPGVIATWPWGHYDWIAASYDLKVVWCEVKCCCIPTRRAPETPDVGQEILSLLGPAAAPKGVMKVIELIKFGAYLVDKANNATSQ